MRPFRVYVRLPFGSLILPIYARDADAAGEIARLAGHEVRRVRAA